MNHSNKFEMTIGTVPGYNHDNKSDISKNEFIRIVDSCARDIESATGIYLAFNVRPVRTVYKTVWGCPDNGEKTYELQAIRNPKFNDDEDKWIYSCIRFAELMKETLYQSTVTMSFTDVQINYLADNYLSDEVDKVNNTSDKSDTFDNEDYKKGFDDAIELVHEIINNGAQKLKDPINNALGSDSDKTKELIGILNTLFRVKYELDNEVNKRMEDQ